MPLVLWNDSLNVGIPEIDHQHKQLIEQMNALVDAMHKNRGTEEIQRIIKFLDQYIWQHFGFEESCMQKYQCPVAAQNKNAHAEFIQNFKGIKEEFAKNGASLILSMRVNEQLLDWFINHIKKIDCELKPCIVDKL